MNDGRWPPPCARGIATGLLAAACVVAHGADLAPVPVPDLGPAPALGLRLDLDQAASLPPAPDERRPFVLLTARWEAVEGPSKVYDWAAHERAIDALDESGYRVALCLAGTHPRYLPDGGPPTPENAESLTGWLAFVRSAARTFAGRVEVFQIRDRVSEVDPATGAADLGAHAFILKNSALAVRAEARAAGHAVAVAQAPIPVGDLQRQKELWAADVAAYVDVLPLIVPAAADRAGASGAVEGFLQETVLHPPAATVWAFVESVGGGRAWDAEAAAVSLLAMGISTAMIRPQDSGPERIAWILGAQRMLAQDYAPAPTGRLELRDEAGVALPGGRILGRFFSDADFSTLVFYLAPGTTDGLPQDRLVVDSSFARNARLVDPVTGELLRVGSNALPDGEKGKSIRVRRSPHPQVVVFDKGAASPDFDLPPEEVETAGMRELTAEEIIARYQQVQKVQDDRLERWTAKGRVDFHFKLAQAGSTIDLSIESNYFWERGGELEWEQVGYYFNGNRITWKKIPELPFIQPEKVITLPLDLTLDKTYRYRRVGRERVAGSEAYVLEFEPVDPDSPVALYRGRVWIDTTTFVRVKANVIQTSLESPVLSNEEVDRYAVQSGPDGTDFWLLSEIDGQQLWSTAGRNLVVRRELVFREFELNPDPEEFERRRAEAYASKNQMLRDTDQGFRYLERQPDGSRTVKDKIDKNALFAALGAFRDSSTDGISPLGGVNYFDYDVRGKNIQLNAFFAGVLGFLTVSKPDLFDRRIDATLDATLIGLKFEDKVFSGDQELLLERIENRPQNVALRLGVPAGQFFKFNFIGNFTVRQFFEEDEAALALARFNASTKTRSLSFTLPQDHLQTTGTVAVEFNRRGYTISAGASWAHRSSWEPWGLFDAVADEYVTCDPDCRGIEAEPFRDSFATWDVTAFKEWYLPKFQKLRGEINYLDGSRLDRFSRYEFSFFGGDRLNGFSGSGVRFDRGLVGRVGYAFNLFEALRVDAALESALVDPPLGRRQSHTGIGLSGSVVGPWRTVISLSYGYALASDIPDLEGEQEFLLLVLKLF